MEEEVVDARVGLEAPSMQVESKMEACAPTIAIAPPLDVLNERTNDEPDTMTTAPSRTWMAPPSASELQSWKTELVIVTLAPLPDTCSGGALEI